MITKLSIGLIAIIIIVALNYGTVRRKFINAKKRNSRGKGKKRKGVKAAKRPTDTIQVTQSNKAEQECKEEEARQKSLAEQKRREEEARQIALAEKKRKKEARQIALAEKKRKESEARQIALAEQKRKEEEARQIALAEQKRKDEEACQKALAEQKRKEEEVRQKELEEKKRKKEARQIALAEKKHKKEARQIASAEKKRKEEEARQIALAEKKRKDEEARQMALAEKKRKEEEARQIALAEKKRKEEEARQIALAEKKRKEEEARQIASAEKKRKEEEARQIASAEKKRKEEEARQIALAEQKRKDEEARQIASAEKKRKEEEARQIALAEQKRKDEEACQKALAEQKRKEEEVRQKELEEKKRKKEARQKELDEKKRKKEARQKALAEKKRKEEEARQIALAEKKRKEEEARQIALAEKKRKEEEARQIALAEQKRKEEEARQIALAEQKRKEEERYSEINTDHILVLKKHNGIAETERIPFVSINDKDIRSIKETIEMIDNQASNKEFNIYSFLNDFISIAHKLSTIDSCIEIIDSKNYCSSRKNKENKICDFIFPNKDSDSFLGDKYQGLSKLEINPLLQESIHKERLDEILNKKYKTEKEKEHAIEIFEAKCVSILEKFLNDVKIYFLLYQYEKTIEDINKRDDIIGYSFKAIGWNDFHLNIDEEFKSVIKSNFGYGRSSYFFIILNYKGVQSIPYSSYIKYRFVGWSEIIRHTREVPLFDKNWEDALNFIKDAYNLCIKDANTFVDKYYIDECRSMISGLHFIFSSKNSREYGNRVHLYEKEVDIFSNEKIKKYEFEKNDDDFILYKLEKISGALNFCDSLKTLREFVNIQVFVDEIFTLNSKVSELGFNYLHRKIEEIKDLELTYLDFMDLNKDLISKGEEYNTIKKDFENKFDKRRFDESDIRASFSKASISIIEKDPDFPKYKDQKLYLKSSVIKDIAEIELSKEYPDFKYIQRQYEEFITEKNKRQRNISTLKENKDQAKEYLMNIKEYFINYGLPYEDYKVKEVNKKYNGYGVAHDQKLNRIPYLYEKIDIIEGEKYLCFRDNQVDLYDKYGDIIFSSCIINESTYDLEIDQLDNKLYILFKTKPSSKLFNYYIITLDYETGELSEKKHVICKQKNNCYVITGPSNSGVSSSLDEVMNKFGDIFLRSTLHIDMGDEYISVTRYKQEERYNYEGKLMETVDA